MNASGVKPSVVTSNALISACGKVEEAMRVFDEMNTSGVKPSVVTFTALISACGKVGKVEDALRVFREMNSVFLLKLYLLLKVYFLLYLVPPDLNPVLRHGS